MTCPILNLTHAVVLAKAAIDWWEGTVDFDLTAQLAQKEPLFIQRARAVLSASKGRVIISASPKKEKA